MSYEVCSITTCQSCDSFIYNTYGNYDKTSPGAEGTIKDTFCNLFPVPRFTDDPLLTPSGMSGSNFKGNDPVRPIHITELQTAINLFRSLNSLSSYTFTTLSSQISYSKINELRAASKSGPSTQANFSSPKYVNRQLPHMPVPSSIIVFNETIILVLYCIPISFTFFIIGNGPTP